jgi:phosphatidylglycerol:prolipoprotein diacylglycerol transferase
VIRPRPWLAHADVIMFAFPFAWIFGRAGCAIVHDHIGRPTTFPLAVNFDAMLEGLGVRHDLGLYECLWAMVISAVFFAVRNRAWPAGSFLVVWSVLYAPVRFGLDFLRRTDEIPGFPTADVRWAGLTPAQWGSLAMLAGGLFLAARLHRPGTPPVGPVVSGGGE